MMAASMLAMMPSVLLVVLLQKTPRPRPLVTTGFGGNA